MLEFWNIGWIEWTHFVHSILVECNQPPAWGGGGVSTTREWWMNRVNTSRAFYYSKMLSIHYLQHLGSNSHTAARHPQRYTPVGIPTCLSLIFDMASTIIRDATKTVTGQQFVALDQYKLHEAGPNFYNIDDLLLIPADKAMLKTSNFTHAFEIIPTRGSWILRGCMTDCFMTNVFLNHCHSNNWAHRWTSNTFTFVRRTAPTHWSSVPPNSGSWPVNWLWLPMVQSTAWMWAR